MLTLIHDLKNFFLEGLTFSKIKTIRNKFAFPVMLLTIMVLIAGGIIRFTSNRNEFIGQLNTKTNTMLRLAVLANQEPLWNYNTNALIANGKALLQDQDVSMVEIQNADGEVLFKKVKQGVESRSNYLITKTQEVKHQSEVIGKVKIGMTTYFSQKRIWEEFYSNLFMILITSLLIWIAISYVSTLVTRPIERIMVNTAKAADGDLKNSITVTSQDEIGVLSNSFNAMIENLREVILQIINVSQALAASSEEFFALSDTSKTTVNEVVANSRDIARRTEEESQNMAEIDALVHETAESIKLMADNSMDASTLSSNSFSVARDGCQTIEAAITKIQDINQSVNGTTDTISNLIELLRKITKFVDSIRNISRQSQLLGLNAAIEAARAGEYGQGFSVVASEIHDLSLQSTEATKQIAEIVAEINVIIDQTVNTMATVSKRMEEEKELTGNAEDALQQIISATEKVVRIVKLIETSAKAQAENSHIVSEKIQVVTGISQNTAAGAQEAYAVMEGYAATIEEIIAAAKHLAQMADELISTTNHFKY